MYYEAIGKLVIFRAGDPADAVPCEAHELCEAFGDEKLGESQARARIIATALNETHNGTVLELVRSHSDLLSRCRSIVDMAGNLGVDVHILRTSVEEGERIRSRMAR